MKISFSNRSVVKYCVTWSREQRLFMIFVVDLNRDLNQLFKSFDLNCANPAEEPEMIEQLEEE